MSRRSTLALGIVGGALTAVVSAVVLFGLAFAMPFVLSTCDPPPSKLGLVEVAVGACAVAAAVPAAIGLVARRVGATSRTWFGISVGWLAIGAAAALLVSQLQTCR
jgi:hypothetical protein